MVETYFGIHAHFYQPPRDNPFIGEILVERGAEPYANWNERITAECYGPNAAAGNFDRLSFNLGGTLAAWLARHRPEVYARIVEADRRTLVRTGVGNAIAQSVHHTILPLARHRDKVLQIGWGIASFEHRFGRRPLGMWVPECAVDTETLECLADAGVGFTIVSEEQLEEVPARSHAGPYRVALPSGRSMAVYARDRLLSNQVSFDMERLAMLGDPADWLRGELGRRSGGRGRRLVLLATDGETFGHHHRDGVAFLQALLSVDRPHDHTSVLALAQHFHEHPPRQEAKLCEPSAWSCQHGVARWSIGCDCTPGDSRWKGALRRALDNLASELDALYTAETQAVGAAGWPLLENYSAVVLQQMDGARYLAAHGLGGLTGQQSARLLALLRAEYHRQRMFTSCAFFFEDLTRMEPRIAIANAAMAVYLARQATASDLGSGFRQDLRHAFSSRTQVTAADVYDAVLMDGMVRLEQKQR